jgi:hypothetical protein
MLANALILTIAILLAVGFWLMDQLKFLIPYKHILFQQYSGHIFAWLATVFANLFAAIYAIQRKFFLKDTGRKLSHIDRQIAAGHAAVPPPEAPLEEH